MTSTAFSPLVLLVEDYDDARDMYRDYLEFSGFRVETARDGREALEKARAIHPDVVLMDLSLPGLHGWEAPRILKPDPATNGRRIIALSAHARGPEGERARAAGCEGFIPKPCLPADLVSQLAVFLKIPGVPVSNGRASRPQRG